MYCPNCGRAATEGQRFCKSCGLNLLSVSQALSGRVTTQEEQKLYRQRMDEIRHGLRTMFTGLGLAIFFFFFKGLGLGFAAIGAIVFFVGLGKIVSATVFASPKMSVDFRWPTQGEAPREPERMPVSVEPRPLEGPPPSITEHTTVRLESPPSVPPRERAGE
jgi:hypothetical protein